MEGHWYKSEELVSIEGLTKLDAWNLLELLELVQQQMEFYEVDKNLHQKLLDTVYDEGVYPKPLTNDNGS